jgi:hypothetical protein
MENSKLVRRRRKTGNRELINNSEAIHRHLESIISHTKTWQEMNNILLVEAGLNMKTMQDKFLEEIMINQENSSRLPKLIKNNNGHINGIMKLVEEMMGKTVYNTFTKFPELLSVGWEKNKTAYVERLKIKNERFSSLDYGLIIMENQ